MKLPPLKKYNESDFAYINRNEIGSFSSVYVCKNLVEDKKVCIKEISDNYTPRVLNELWNLWKCIDCPNVIKILGYITPKKIVLEYGGYNLFDYISKSNISLTDRKRIANQCIASVEQIQKKGIIHLDIKLDNFVIKNGLVKLIDFGFSQSTYHIKPQYCGTIGYISPEMFEKPPKISFNNDIWSLGVLLYELLTLRSPFDLGDISKEEIIERIKNIECDYSLIPCDKYRILIQNIFLYRKLII